MINTAAYLTRIGHDGSTAPTVQTLRELQRAHLLAVPFENLDIALGRPITLDEGSRFAKIVGARRGGFCYELNGLFAALLRALGFRVTMLGAGVRHALDAAGPTFGPDHDHLCLRVDLETPWLVDVGFGDAFIEPLRLDTDAEQVDSGRSRPILASETEGIWTDRYRIVAVGEYRHLQRVSWDGAWHDRYRFTLAPRDWQEFGGMCRYHQTDPASGFTRSRTCSLATPNGRVTVAESRLIQSVGTARTETPLPDEAAWRAALHDHCGVTLPAAPAAHP